VKITTNVKGQIAISKAELRAIELGYIPSKPIFDTRYDLILDNHQKLIKVQIKYADGKMSNSEGAVMVKLGYQDRKKNIYTYQKEEIDALIVYLPKINKLCYFPCEVFVGKEKIHVRYLKPKNNQIKGILYAEKYYW
jgi:hypothetical protein